ncbi:pentatricopeptide repeat-containing protein At3g22150, chloroplastic [Macadamia integrifolia]|uniref:pentatricopeptide repeat-containing protein At3g22150, chloroplastic n=1 Tax=Macadamia integrifolia TaxID=60698 RepID=UPI001C4FBE88|nr:pentatricopeptide repeat-containing protein At3g22150, chloroplastic [Macadamia integrifolia]XP_042506124.1 pentatricopeptide repeat-containing protein At3g22150, chloroplastic [Macadamia integrifolia]XP_042506125.1 pentatricopeptide repeat-containing protein At3g22150, chloroplastic [Macadamia integrifolia]XP_042506126.1 pentatricopeptide repeat-containing protein At3g22150, chloroplastic [Macadamia integrifolia]XP_042506128.1 pentatricopeptide repeat-containing protein At3g22150, chloropla
MASRSSTLPPVPIPNSYRNVSKPYRLQNCSYSNSTIANLPTKIEEKQRSPVISENSQSLLQIEISSKSKPKTPTIRSRLSQLCQEGQPEVARRLFDTIPCPTTVLWNTIIIGFICNGMHNEALRFYVRMRTCTTIRSDSYTYSSVLKACAESQQLKFGKAVHCQILRSHTNPSRIVSNSLLNMYSNCLSPSFEIQEDRNGSGVFKFPQSDVVQKLFDGMRKRSAVAWNTIIAWYVKTGRFVEALKQFRQMIHMGIKLTVVSFINVFPAVASIRDQKNSGVLYGLLLKMGSEYVSDLFAASSAIFMYSELGDMVSARQVFDLCTERNIEVWNTMISGYVQNDHPAEGLNLFIKVLDLDKIIPDNVTFLTALTATSQLQQLDFGRQLHAYVIKNLMASNVVISNALISMYSRCDLVEAAFMVFDKMPERDLVSWNTMVSAFVQNGLDDEGLMLVYEMQKQGFVIDSITATALLSAASNLRNQKIGKETHAYLFRHWIQFEGMDSYLIDMYTKAGLIDAAEKLFEKNCVRDRDQVTWNAMISGYSQNGQIEQALIVFRQMLQQQQLPNAVTLASILPACSPVGGIGFGKQLHGFAFRHTLDQNVFVGTSLIDMYSKCGEISYAERVFTRLPEINSVTYTTMISGYGQHGLGERALSLFQSMPLSGMKPDAVAFVAVLSACSYSGLVDEGLQIFESMEDEYMIARKPEHYCCVVDMLGRAGRVMEAYELVNELGDEANVVGLWGSLLGACRIHKKYELGKVVSERLLEMEKGNGMAGYHVLLSNIYAEERKWDNVESVRKEMRERGLRKEAGCSWIEISGVVNCFTSRDQKHPQCDLIYAKLEELSMEIKVAGYRPCLSSEYEE